MQALTLVPRPTNRDRKLDLCRQDAAQELEADRLGVFMMAKAGYEPRAAAELWRRMDQRGAGVPAILSAHPAPQARIEAIEALIPEAVRAARA